MSQLARMLENTARMIELKAPGTRVKVKVRGVIGEVVGHFEVIAKLDKPGLTCPDEMTLKYSGSLTLGALAMQAGEFLESVVDAQVYPLEENDEGQVYPR